MQKLSQFIAKYLWAFILIGVLSVGMIVFYLAGLYSEHQTNKAVQQTHIAANVAVAESVNAQRQADNSLIERQTEDRIRQKTIAPKLEKTRVNSTKSKADLQRVVKNYENEKLHPQNLDSTDADNCRRLAVLFPEAEFVDCR